MAHCEPCADGNHDRCKKENGEKTTGCPAFCQHRKTTQVEHAGEVYSAPQGVTGIVSR